MRVPVGVDAERWLTRSGCRRVLGVVQSVAAGNRLFDVMPLVESDRRVQIVFTTPQSSAWWHGASDMVRNSGWATVPWSQATQTRFDAILAASYGGITQLHGPIVVMPHGVGHGRRRPRPDNGTPETSPRYFGMAPEFLLNDGRVVPTAIVLSHVEQLARLAQGCPEAVPAALVAGDPCHDRIAVSRPLRAYYRRAFGVTGDQRLVLVSSTWGRGSLFGQHPDLLGRLVDELPRRRYRVAAVLHPNIGGSHGHRQVHGWLRQPLAEGLMLVPPEEGWQAAVVAADVIVGDHGSVTQYGAATGAPVILAAFADDELDPRCPAAVLATLAPRLDLAGPLAPQLDNHLHAHLPGRYRAATDLITSLPGESARVLRALIYRLLRLPEPSEPAMLSPVPLPRDLRSAADWERRS